MKRIVFLYLLLFFCAPYLLNAQKIFPGADETTPSRAQYFSWINNSNEGTTGENTLINMEFFKWLHDDYGMILDIYAFDAGAIDGKRFYGSVTSNRFKNQFPDGFQPLYEKAKRMGTRLGVWGGPDGFGNTLEEEKARTEQMVSLCRDFEFALFKFDAVCGPLRPEKEDAFINMMQECRKYSPDLILLNHRLGLERAQDYATTFLWGGDETYIDVFMCNRVTAPHHRAGALSRGLPPDLLRLTEDHGVCISSCIDYWDDDLVLQAFNRNLILSPQIYANPWFMRDNEFPKLARIYKLHRKYRDIMVEGMVLPEAKYGPYAVSRGNGNTRIITLRNLSWEPVKYTVKLDEEIGLESKGRVEVRTFHPLESVIVRNSGEKVEIEVPPFRSFLMMATTEDCDEPGIFGVDYRVIRNIDSAPVEVELTAMPGTTAGISLKDHGHYKSAILVGKSSSKLLKGKKVKIDFGGEELKFDPHRYLTGEFEIFKPDEVNWETLYEATVFSADNNALEVRSLERSGQTDIPQVKAARDAFFSQTAFVNRGIWDKNMFDGDYSTSFFPSVRKYYIDQRINRGCLRLDVGENSNVDQLVLHTPDEYSLQPLLLHEGNHVEASNDLRNWDRYTYLADTIMIADFDKPYRYFRFNYYADRITEIEGYINGNEVDRSGWRASNLFSATGRDFTCKKVWKTTVKLEEIHEGSYLSIAINGKHGVEGAYAAAIIDGKLVGAPDRATSYASNTWEYVNCRSAENYTYYIPLEKEYEGKEAEIYVMGFDQEALDFVPEVWISANPMPYKKIKLVLERK